MTSITKYKNTNPKKTENIKSINIDLQLKDLTQYINNIEKRFGNYLFNKYVIPKTTINFKIRTPDISKEYINKCINDEFKKFKLNFYFTKANLITQYDIIKTDVFDIKKANMLYFRYPELEKKKTRTEYGYPDKYRCNFIRMNKHKMSRCKSKITDDEEFSDGMMCSKHLGIDNIYRVKYYEIYNTLI